MNHPVRRLAGAAVCALALCAAPLAAVPAAAQPPPGCAPGYTGITNGCNPFCVPGKFLNTQTGLCEPLPPPPPRP
jgi:hypothetical protein